MEKIFKRATRDIKRAYTTDVINKMTYDEGKYCGGDVVEFKFSKSIYLFFLGSALFFFLFPPLVIFTGALKVESPKDGFYLLAMFFGIAIICLVCTIIFLKKIIYIKSQKVFVISNIFKKKTFYMYDIDYVKSNPGDGYIFYIKGKKVFKIGLLLENSGEVLFLLKENRKKIV
ncbi:MAG: hypothetical protein IJA94_02400 [Bacilli bacterium]|nr:hypothetical protein [Bacilli bacterium]